MASKKMDPQVKLQRQIQRFWEQVIIPDDPDACWGWRRKVHNGYAQFRLGDRMWGAHTISWSIAQGIMPDQIPWDPTSPRQRLSVIHSCRSRSCTNPRHLHLGTHQENMNDKQRDGTASKPHLTEEQVEQILLLMDAARAADEIMFPFCERIAPQFDVTPMAIWSVVKGAAHIDVRPDIVRLPTKHRRAP